MTITQYTWEPTSGDVNRLELCRPCSCGCDSRLGNRGVGYLIGTSGKGVGFTVWIESEEVFQALEQVVGTVVTRR